MKLKALDQIHISSVQADSLRPGQEFEVSDDLGEKMLKSLPGRLEQVAESAAAAKAEQAPQNKAEDPPENKAISAAPAKKATASRKAKGK